MGLSEIMTYRALVMAMATFGLVGLSVTGAQGKGLPKHVVCHFNSGTATTFDKGAFQTKKPKALSFEISNINLGNQSANLVGLGRAAEGRLPGKLKIVRAINANHFIEVVSEGYLNLTTIYDGDGSSGTFPAVHSRHGGILGQPIFAQYTGLCSAKK